MEIEKQNEFLLNLLNRLFVDLGAHLAFVEFVKNQAGDAKSEVEIVLAKCRRDPGLQPHVDATLLNIAAKLRETDELDPDRYYRKFLERWNPAGKPN